MSEEVHARAELTGAGLSAPGADLESLTISALARHATTGLPFSDVVVEVVADGTTVVTRAQTGRDGLAVLDLDADSEGSSWTIRLAGSGDGVPLGPEVLEGSQLAVLDVPASGRLEPDTLAALADQLVATRLVRVEEVASDLATPREDSIVRVLPAGDRSRLLDSLMSALEEEEASLAGDAHLVDPAALRDGQLSVVSVRDLSRELIARQPGVERDLTRPGIAWDLFGWALPDDQSYRDYLRSVFVLFAHQQKLGVSADPRTFPDVVEQQLQRRFFQDFRTVDRVEAPLNGLLVPIVTAILTAPVGSGFGFGLDPAQLPVGGALTDRQHLDALLALTQIPVAEFANRYRLPLDEPDTAVSTPVMLNVHTLSRVLSDTAQGPVEPPENVIAPQLPGEEGRPILWPSVVGSAPYFLRFDEWLARQQPFFPENLFALRTQVVGTVTGPWLDEKRKKFLEFHKSRPLTHPVSTYAPYFASMGEVHRSATFLLDYGAADAKLTELVQAIDKSQFAAAARLAEEAQRLLESAIPTPTSSEDWEPESSVGNFPRPLSLAKRRSLRVSTIVDLTGTRTQFVPDGFERFFELARPIEEIQDVVHFRIARDQATRLRTYQQRFLLPMLRATVRMGLGDLPGSIELLAGVTGFHIGIAMLGTPAGMIRHPDAIVPPKRVVAGRLRWSDPLGDRPYTARLMYDAERRLDGPYPLTPQLRNGSDALTPEPPILHPLEERYARIQQADALLAWAEMLYRSDDAASLERARELYKAVVFLHGEDPGTSAYRSIEPIDPVWFGLAQNPRVRNQLDRARLALQQLAAGLNFYGYNGEAVPTLRYETLVGAAQRWAAGAKSAQNDYLTYLTRVEQLDLDLLAAKAQERKAGAAVAIAAEQVEIAKAGVVVAQKLVADVEKLIAAKRKEIEDANSIFSQFSDYFTGMKSSVSSLIDVGKSASEGWGALKASSAGEALGVGQGGGAGAGAGGQSVGLGSAAGGLAVVGGFAAFAILSTTTLQGMADAATKRDAEFKALQNEALPAARAAVRVQERNVTIARLQGDIAATDLAYARDLITYQNERFLNRDFWEALAGVARRSLHRYLDLAGQAAWFAERALAYQVATPIRVIQLGYFDLRMRDVGGVDRLALDLAELEAVRLGAARVTVPITRTYSLARDLPLAFGRLKRTGRCTFTLSDDDLIRSHPGTFAHRVRAIEVIVDAPGTLLRTHGILTNSGFSMLRSDPGTPPVPLVRFADAYPISEFRLRRDLAVHGLPGEQLLPFEGTGFSTTWVLTLPEEANPTSLARVTDVRLRFEVQAAYDAQPPVAAAPATMSRARFVSALAVDAAGFASLRTPAAKAQIRFPLNDLAIPRKAEITNLAIIAPGVEGGVFKARLKVGPGPEIPFQLDDGLALSNAGALGDGDPSHAKPLNNALGGSPARPVTLEITKGNDADRLAEARDVLLWVEYAVTS